jgi:hypothetical protein
LPLGSYLCLNGFDNGWPSIFYIYGKIWFLDEKMKKKIILFIYC